jgi:hypothetical protein
LQELEADGTQIKSHPIVLMVVVNRWVLLQEPVSTYKNFALKPV